MLGAVVAVAGFVKVMSHEAYRRTGTNAAPAAVTLTIAPSASVCQGGEFVPAGSGSIAPWVGGVNGAPGAELSALVTEGGRTVASGRLPRGYVRGVTRIPLRAAVPRDYENATVCFKNESPAPVNFFGDFVAPGKHGAVAPGGPANLRLDWFAPKPQTWWGTVNRIAERFPLVKASFLGPWSFWVALAILLAVSATAVTRVVREAKP